MAPILHPKVGCSRPSLRQDDAGTKVTLDTDMSEKPDQSLTRDAIRAMRRSYGDTGLETLPEDQLLPLRNGYKKRRQMNTLLKQMQWCFQLWALTMKSLLAPFF